VLLCAPDGVPEHLKDVHLQSLDLTQTGFFFNFGSFFNEAIIHDQIIKIKKNIYPHNTPFLPLSFATLAISLVPWTWDISRVKTVSGLLDHPVDLSASSCQQTDIFFIVRR
jgi:hypothetical protein